MFLAYLIDLFQNSLMELFLDSVCSVNVRAFVYSKDNCLKDIPKDKKEKSNVILLY